MAHRHRDYLLATARRRQEKNKDRLWGMIFGLAFLTLIGLMIVSAVFPMGFHLTGG